MVKGYVDQPIGLIELLLRYGYIDPRLSAKELPNDKAYQFITKEILQFRNQLSYIEITKKELDVDMVFIPKGYYK